MHHVLKARIIIFRHVTSNKASTYQYMVVMVLVVVVVDGRDSGGIGELEEEMVVWL